MESISGKQIIRAKELINKSQLSYINPYKLLRFIQLFNHFSKTMKINIIHIGLMSNTSISFVFNLNKNSVSKELFEYLRKYFWTREKRYWDSVLELNKSILFFKGDEWAKPYENLFYIITVYLEEDNVFYMKSCDSTNFQDIFPTEFSYFKKDIYGILE